MKIKLEINKKFDNYKDYNNCLKHIHFLARMLRTEVKRVGYNYNCNFKEFNIFDATIIRRNKIRMYYKPFGKIKTSARKRPTF